MNDKNAYEMWAEGKINEISARIEQFKAKAQQADANARIEAERQIASFNEQKQDIQSRLQDLKKAGKDAGEEIQSGARKALQDLKDSVDRAVSNFKE
jgi:hypothetical protein